MRQRSPSPVETHSDTTANRDEVPDPTLHYFVQIGSSFVRAEGVADVGGGSGGKRGVNGVDGGTNNSGSKAQCMFGDVEMKAILALVSRCYFNGKDLASITV